MNIDDGKRLYDKFSEANKTAEKMSSQHNEGFRVYKVGNFWAVGGIHMKTSSRDKKIKSFEDIRLLLNEFKISEDDICVEDYINEIADEALNSESAIQGQSDDWILTETSLCEGRNIGMSPDNNRIYLVLTVCKNSEKFHLKMGGNFSKHIPLIKKQAEKLFGKAVIWHTWNSNRRKTSWSNDSWFYRIEEKNFSG